MSTLAIFIYVCAVIVGDHDLIAGIAVAAGALLLEIARLGQIGGER